MRPPNWQTEDGSIRLWCGDCLELLPQLEAGSVDAVVTDPPYEITASGGGIGSTRKDLNATDGFTDCGFDYSLLDRFDCWVCFGTLRQVPKLIERAGDRRWMLVTWNKHTEYIVHAWRSGRLYGGFSDKARYIVHPLGDKEHGEHPNEKPYLVMRKMVVLASDFDDLVLDPFMSSGTTGVACVRTGRRFIGIEREPKYFAIACRRIEAELRKTALLEPVPKIVQRSLLEESA